jgi:hypothetical protein
MVTEGLSDCLGLDIIPEILFAGDEVYGLNGLGLLKSASVVAGRMTRS